ncbi:AAA family ATPase [Streptomyces sp. CY1]|uniref:helix-turn-helix transcriptional regulator n=1 Tax=Streptomyces sp. CY1 TaxID=3388313 RepID=UPI0039A34949
MPYSYAMPVNTERNSRPLGGVLNTAVHLGHPFGDSLVRPGQALLVDGPLACGKTTLLRSFAERASESGYLTISATCSPSERDLPFGVVSQLARGAWKSPGGPPEVPGLPDILRGAGDPVDRAGIARLCHRLCTSLIDHAEHTPLLLAVDDVRHSDPASAAFLLQLVRRLDSARIAAVFTDDLSLSSSLPLRYELLRAQHLRRIGLGPLSPGQVAEVVVAELGETARRHVGDILAATGGNRLLLHTLLSDYREYGEARQTGYGQSFLSCLHRNEPIFLDVVRALAVVGSALPAADLAWLTGHEPEPISQVLAALTGAGLMDEGAFRQETARLSVLNDMPAQARRTLHQRAARLLHDQGRPAATIARHLVRAGQIPDSWSAEVLLEVAEQVAVGEEASIAVDLLEQSFEQCPHEERRAALRAKLAEAEWKINPSTATRHHAPLYGAVRAGRLGLPDSVTLLMQLLWKGGLSEVEGLLAHLRADPAATDQLHAIEAALTCTYPWLAERRAAPPHHGGAAATRAAAWPRAGTVLADVLTGGQTHDTVRRAEEVLRELQLGHDPACHEQAGLFALLALVYGGRNDLASAWCEGALGETGGGPHVPMRQAVLSAARSEIALRRGDLAEAAEQSRAALTHASPGAWGVAIGLPLGALILACTRMGRHEEAGFHVAQTVPNAMFKSSYGLHYLYARGHYFLAAGRHQAALADFLLCGELLTDWGLSSGCDPVPWRIGAAEAWLAQGNHDQARILVYQQLSRPHTDGARARGQSLRLLAATSSAKRRPQLLNEAVGLFTEQEDKYELARTLWDLSQAYHALGEKKQARRTMRRAWHVAKMCDAASLYEEWLPADDQGHATGPTPKSDTAIERLTHSERRVASLAAMGYTNREIAGKLYVTASTVEQHLTRVFRKLDIKHREQLPTELYADRMELA